MEMKNISESNIINQQENTTKLVDRKISTEIFKKSSTNETNKKKIDYKELDSAVDKANKVLFKNNTHLQFRIHKKTNEVMVKIINDETGEVVKEIPPEKMLDMVAKLWEIAGILVDEKR